jgi:hypothetical protein
MGDHNFSASVVGEIGKAAMYVCSNPGCLRFTGYETTEGRPRTIAEGAHVLPSGKNGPRHGSVAAYPGLDLSSAENGIWLCLGCHQKIDDDPTHYEPSMLFSWKENHAKLLRRIVGLDLEAALLQLQNTKRYHQEVRELISYFDNRRVLYEGLDHEFPPRVLESIDMMRTRITDTRARVKPDSDVFNALGRMQDSINDFLRNLGPKTNLRKLQRNGGDPTWLKFSSELMKFREDMMAIINDLATASGYQMSHVGM